jgi:hypothetical protein
MNRLTWVRWNSLSILFYVVSRFRLMRLGTGVKGGLNFRLPLASLAAQNLNLN